MTAPASPLRIMLSAVEPSGDALGAALMKALKARRPDVVFSGCGGPLMAEEGLTSLFPIDVFSVIGPAGALKAAPAAFRGAGVLAQSAAASNADAAVLIDSWSFSNIAANRIRRVSPRTRLIKYVAPQVWASRPKRAEKLAALFDGVLTLFDFEVPYFERAGADARFVGSSTFQVASRAGGDRGAFRRRHSLGDASLLAVLPGSRRAETRRLAEPFGETLRLLHQAAPDLRAVVVAAPAVEADVRAVAASWPCEPVVVAARDRSDAFAAADAALAASGTVTTELAISGTPMAIGYRVHWATAMWIRSVITTPYVALINIAAQREVIPEFLQENCRPEAMAAVLRSLLRDEAARRAQLEAFPDLLAKLGVGGADAADRAAEAVLDWI